MSGLKMKTVTVHEVNYSDLDDFISFTYGTSFEIVADQEMSNDSSKVITVKKEGLRSWDQQALDDARLGKFFRPGSLYPIMTDLCNRNLIPEGKYVIRVSW